MQTCMTLRSFSSLCRNTSWYFTTFGCDKLCRLLKMRGSVRDGT